MRRFAFFLLACAIASTASSAPKPLVVAVLYFDNNSANKQYDVLQKGLADMMVTDLSAVEGVQIVEREKLQKLIEELNLQQTSFFDPSTAQKLGRGIGANYAVAGAIASIEPEVRLDVRLIDVATGQVLLADKVVGPNDRFFELQEQLVSKFAAGIERKREGLPAGNRVRNVTALLDYSKGVDAEDHGDLQDASVRLARLVQEVPDFRMARLRQDEIARRLKASGKKREAALTGISDELLQHCDEQLRTGDVAELTLKEAGRHFGYRALRGDYILASIEKRLHPKALIRAMYGESTVPAASQEEIFGLERAWLDNADLLLAELKAVHLPHGPSYRIDPEDQERARTVGVRWRFQPESLYAMDIGLARFILLGAVQPSEPVVRPSLGQRDAAAATRALRLIDEALAGVKEQQGKKPETEFIRAQELAGEGLLLIGRRTEGLAKLQGILDEYPASSEYTRIEKKITDEAQADRDDVEDTHFFRTGPCDNGGAGIAAQALQRVMKRGGMAGVRNAVASYEQHCSGETDQTARQSVYMTAGSLAMIIGECSELQALRDKSAKLGTLFISAFDGLIRQCK